jgi:ribosome-associated protein
MKTTITQKFGPLERAELLLKAAVSKKAFDPVLIRLNKHTTLTDYFLIVSGLSARHVKAISEAVVVEAKKEGVVPQSTEGLSLGTWALLDYGDVIVHVFLKQTREFYDLEGLWREAPREPFSQELLDQIEKPAEDEDDEWEED